MSWQKSVFRFLVLALLVSLACRASPNEQPTGTPIVAAPTATPTIGSESPTAVPNTPTPVLTELPPTLPPVADAPLLAYIQGGNLFVAQLNWAGDLLTAGTINQLTNDGDAINLQISPDGQKIVFIRSVATGNEELVLINSDGSGHILLAASSSLPPVPDTNPAETGRVFGQLQWLANSQTILFNTRWLSLVGPGIGEANDLWSVSAGNVAVERLAPGMGGGQFAISAANELILSTPTEVFRVREDGQRETLITFPFVNTASEYAYYPTIQWVANETAAFVAIPSPNAWETDATTTIWRITSGGAAESFASLPGNTLFNPVIWSATGSWLAYVHYLVDPTNPPPHLVIADGLGGNATGYTNGSQLRFLGWSEDEIHFVYAGEGFYAVGTWGGEPIILPMDVGTVAQSVDWVSPTTFVMTVGSFGNWQINSGNLTGSSTTLAVNSTDLPAFDVWTP